MDSYYFTPEQRFYSAAKTAELLSSTHGEVSLINNDSKIKTEHLILGGLVLGTIITIIVIQISANKKKSEKNSNVSK